MKLYCLRTLLSLLGAALAITLTVQGADPNVAPPNIVFLLSDDQTVRALGCYGNPDVITPNLDQLASEGVRFTNHYNTTSICMASRCSVLTGLYEYRHGCNFEHGDLERRFMEQSYPLRLRQAGYYTGFAGKVGFVLQGEKFEALEPLFDDWAGGPGQTEYETAQNSGIAQYADRYPHCSRAYAAWGADFLKRAKASGKPFCMSISFKAPHLPFTPEPVDLQLYQGKTVTRPANYGVANAKHLSPQSQTSRAATGYREWINDYEESARKYYALITGVDAAVGMIRKSLAQEGLAENTVIIFTSDNGYNSGSHGFGDKVLPYEEGSKSPLIIYDPRLPRQQAGAVCQALTANVDMAATIFALVGEPAPENLDGQNLQPLLANPTAEVRQSLPLFNFWGTPSAQSMAVVTRDWKYIYWYYGSGGLQPTEELFHLGEDPYEMVPLAQNPRYSAKLEEMRLLYDTELSNIQARLVGGHGYESFPILFDRTTPWDQKAPRIDVRKRGNNNPGNASTGNKKRKSTEP